MRKNLSNLWPKEKQKKGKNKKKAELKNDPQEHY